MTRTNVTSFCMQFEKWGRGLLREAFRSKGEWAGGWKLEGEKGEYQSWKTEVNIGVLPENKYKPKIPNRLLTFISLPPPGLLANNPLSITPESFPHPLFSNCIQSDITSVRRCWTSFRKKAIVYTVIYVILTGRACQKGYFKCHRNAIAVHSEQW